MGVTLKPDVEVSNACLIKIQLNVFSPSLKPLTNECFFSISNRQGATRGGETVEKGVR